MRLAIVTVMICLGTTVARAETIQDAAVTTSTGREIRLGAYAAFKRDCSGGTAAGLRPAGDQRGGVVAVTSGTLSTTHVPGCGSVTSPARILSYRPNPGFTGADRVTFDVVDSGTGQTQTHSVAVTVTP